MKKISGSAYFYIVIMVLTLVIIGLSLGMKYFDSKLLPLIIGGAVFVLAAIGLMLETKARDKQRGEKTRSAATREGWRGYWFAGAWVVGLFLAIGLLGFIIAIPLYILAYMKSHDTRWLTAIAFAILTSLFIYGIFELALRIPLYRGLLLSWLGY